MRNKLVKEIVGLQNTIESKENKIQELKEKIEELRPESEKKMEDWLNARPYYQDLKDEAWEIRRKNLDWYYEKWDYKNEELYDYDEEAKEYLDKIDTLNRQLIREIDKVTHTIYVNGRKETHPEICKMEEEIKILKENIKQINKQIKPLKKELMTTFNSDQLEELKKYFLDWFPGVTNYEFNKMIPTVDKDGNVGLYFEIYQNLRTENADPDDDDYEDLYEIEDYFADETVEEDNMFITYVIDYDCVKVEIKFK